MTEYVPDDHHDGHDTTPPADLPDQHPDDTFSEQHLPPLDDIPSAHAPVPDELHFPGDDPSHDAPVDADAELDPSAPWPDDDRFTDWLGGPEHADDPSADAELRDQLAAPPADAGGPQSSGELVDWALRHIDE
jgi:hypothetical protein